MTKNEDTETEGVDAVPALTELHDFELSPDPGFTDRVRRMIHRREAASGLVDLSIRGFLKLLFEYLSTLIEVVFPPSDLEDEEKE